MAKNSNLNAAKAAKNDEFYTLYKDIEKELVNYEDQLRGKVVYCNCDDVRYSNFLEYMCRVAPHIGIRKVIGSHYDKGASQSYYVTFVPPPNLDHWDGDDWERYLIEMPMEGDGDFRSEASIRLLQQADVVITNPPFSLFREFVAQLVEYNKKFLIIGRVDAVSYKEIFPLFKDNKMWYGVSLNATKCSFKVPDSYESKYVYYEDGVRLAQVNNAIWFTNMDIAKRHQLQELFLSYERHDRPYEKYDNYDVINVDKGIEIPKDYYDTIGVPITWLRYYCPEQFEIIGMAARWAWANYKDTLLSIGYKPELGGNGIPIINGKNIYNRILIRRRRRE